MTAQASKSLNYALPIFLFSATPQLHEALELLVVRMGLLSCAAGCGQQPHRGSTRAQ